jgi:hypothetical protein
MSQWINESIIAIRLVVLKLNRIPAGDVPDKYTEIGPFVQ